MIRISDSDFAMLHPLSPSDRLKFILPKIYNAIDAHYQVITDGINENLLQPETTLFTSHFLLPFVTIYQFFEGLCDSQTVNLLSSRTDWHDSLHLSGTIQVIPENYLCEYRKWLLAKNERVDELQTLLDRIFDLDPKLGIFSGVTKSVDLIRQLCYIHQIEIVHDALTSVLETLAYHHSDWLRQIAKPEWFVRYRATSSEKVIKRCRDHYVESFLIITEDMGYLINKIVCSAPEEINHYPEVVVLMRIWKRLVQRGTEVSFKPDLIDCRIYSSQT